MKNASEKKTKKRELIDMGKAGDEIKFYSKNMIDEWNCPTHDGMTRGAFWVFETTPKTYICRKCLRNKKCAQGYAKMLGSIENDKKSAKN